MSVLIKGMEMPTHCTECDFWHDGVFEHCLLNMEIQNEDVPLDEGEYPTACPLVPVPPSVYVRPVKRGKWMHKEITADFHVVGQCSVCKERRRLDNFCSNCGADMRGEHQ